MKLSLTYRSLRFRFEFDAWSWMFLTRFWDRFL